MKEIKEIIKAFDAAVQSGEQVALATVVRVDGSSYRRPGARMLVTENGMLTGAISGGCLEGDALRKAQLVMFQKKSMLVTYDTTDDDDAKFGVGLGCNGIIHVLIEPIDPDQENHPVDLLKKCLVDRTDKVLVTLFDIDNKRIEQKGTCLLHQKEGDKFTGVEEKFATWSPPLQQDIKEVLASGQSLITSYTQPQRIHAFVEFIQAPITLILVGAGNDVIPLSRLTDLLGWETIIVDGRANHATRHRFPKADDILVGKAEELVPVLRQDKRTAVVLMTHNFNYDLAIMKGLLPLKIPYLGVLGPKKKLEKMIENVENENILISKEDLSKIFGPVGLNIGAEAPEEIALSIVAEIKAVFSGEKGTFLKDKTGPIHDEERKRLLKFSSQ